ncbi:type I-E CRISPR-associated protein Cse2/CasB [Streptomyces sp. NPDC127068]|uniref:type I-E CRISPR-associated protein Cse2/CasB n=1 Tax=Streptomyces sp. NPDC127068 TaxID=3347127 RepID=UPI00364FA7F3
MRPHFWESFTPEQPYAAADLAALRAGVGCEPGTVRRMWALYRVRVTEADRVSGQTPVGLVAEHAVLTLFGVHQQGRTRTVHQSGAGLGDACWALRNSGRSSPEAVGRRLAAMAGSLDLGELTHHLRAVVAQLRGAGLGLDYTRLFFDLRAWQQEGAERDRRVRAWGLQYCDLARSRARAGAGVGVAEATDAVAAGGQEPDVLGFDAERTPFWDTYAPSMPGAGANLAALRSGVNREAGTVPAMWHLYRTTVSLYEQCTGALGRPLAAEHAALALFGVHQYGRRRTMHTSGVSLGMACGNLRRSAQGSAEALERRFANILTSVDSHELAQHLRGLVPMLGGAEQPLDYGLLRADLLGWDDPERQSRIRSRWDKAYRAGGTPSD